MFDAQSDTQAMTDAADDGLKTARATGALPATKWASMTFAELAAALGVATPCDPRVADISFPVRRIKAGETLHRAGDRFDAIYIVRSGFFKTARVHPNGDEQVLGFPMGGDVIGLDGVDQEQYTIDAVALDTSLVVVVSFAHLSRLAREFPFVERMLYGVFSRELALKQSMIWLLGTLSAEARVATFLLHLGERYSRLGYSRSTFMLRMTREEIGSYLGIKLETVSRTLSAFAAAGLIEVDRRSINVRDAARLQRVVEPQSEAPRRMQAATSPARTPSAPRPRTMPRASASLAPSAAA